MNTLPFYLGVIVFAGIVGWLLFASTAPVLTKVIGTLVMLGLLINWLMNKPWMNKLSLPYLKYWPIFLGIILIIGLAASNSTLLRSIRYALSRILRDIIRF